MSATTDSVHSIHRWNILTLINPSTHKHSLVFAFAVTAVLGLVTHFSYTQSEWWFIHVAAVIGVLVITQYTDTFVIRHREYSKSIHLSLFGTATWLVAISGGIAASAILGQSEAQSQYFVVGMFIFASFRIGIFTSVLGTGIKKAWIMCMVSPLAMFLALIPMDMWGILVQPVSLMFGAMFLITGTVWSILTDRAGRPILESTHGLIQAYLLSIRRDNSEIEALLEKNSDLHDISTTQIRLHSGDEKTNVRLVLPGVHPGPYHPIGGSNIPYLIYRRLDSSAMVMHSISNHTLNLPSQVQVNRYLDSLDSSTVEGTGSSCTEPVIVQVNRARVIGVMFERNALLVLSLSPHGMEDLPTRVKTAIDEHSHKLGVERTLVIDSHNAMGAEISSDDENDMLSAARSCLDTLHTKTLYTIDVGYANSAGMDVMTPDLGMGGLGILCLKINGKSYFLGWADSNNMENGMREHIVEKFASTNRTLLDICTSDTHFSRTKVRTKNGYYQFGVVTDSDKVASWYLDIAQRAEESASRASFEVLVNKVKLKIMGEKIFEDYSGALYRALRFTKIMSVIGMGVYIANLIFVS